MLIGLTGQIVLLPVLAWALARGFNLSDTLTAGLVLLALCPGGISSNLAAHLAEGNRALSVSLTAVSSIITVFTLPLVLNWMTHANAQMPGELSLPLLPTIQRLATLTLAPLAAGIMCRQYFSSWVQRHHGKVTLMASLLFVLVIASVWQSQWQSILLSAEQTGAVALSLNLLALAIGFGLAKLAGLQRAEQITLGLEIGLQNSALAVLVAVNIIGIGELAIPASVYSVVMVCSAISVILLSRLKGSSTGSPAEHQSV